MARDLYPLVKEALDNALENDFPEPCFTLPALETAQDIVLFFPELEDEKPENIVPLVERWRQENKQ